MTSIVMKMGQGRTENLVTDLAKYQISSKNPYVTFAAKSGQTTISLYSSGKIVFQGTDAEEVAAQFGYLESAASSHIAAQRLQAEGSMIGSDEVGNGSYFGGLAVVASFVKKEDYDWLKSLGVDDSKRLTDQKIQTLAPLLMEKIPHKALLLTPQKYNEVVGAGLKHNAVSVKVAMHNQAIYLLLEQLDQVPDNIVIDAFTSSKNYQNYVEKEVNQLTQAIHLEEKAEGKYLAVAVSSIIARHLFLENLKELSQTWGMTLPSGAGPKSDQVASQLLKKSGLAALAASAKLHFANTKKAEALLKKP